MGNKEFIVSHGINLKARFEEHKVFNYPPYVSILIGSIILQWIFHKVYKSKQFMLHLQVVQWLVFIVSLPVEILLCSLSKS